MQALPLSLYIHLPWCQKKCPYCDFNSHARTTASLPEQLYVSTLLQDLEEKLALIADRPLISIFLGGGTPSLFSGSAIAQLLTGIQSRHPLTTQAEVTLEANPGTMEQERYEQFRAAGVTRLSLGVQSFHDDQLMALGRIHNGATAHQAIQQAKQAGFTQLNLDLMYGLPQQSLAAALADLNMAIAHEPDHLSWYQLTLEPNTLFYHHPPPLPSHDVLWNMQIAGQRLLRTTSLQQYEVSAYATNGAQSQHNLNYWQFGDYLGLGAGAHSKLTNSRTHTVKRLAQVRHPQDYLNPQKRRTATWRSLGPAELMFEFMLNTQRLIRGVPNKLFAERTGLPLSSMAAKLQQAEMLGLLQRSSTFIRPTPRGRRFLNDLVALFLCNTAED